MSERNQPIISGIEGTVTIHSDVDATTSAILLNNWTANVAPTVTDDSNAGYAIGSEWTDLTADKSYKLVDATVGAAVWKEITAAGGGGGDVATDPIWDVEGDLVVATGNDAATRIPIGSAGTFLRSDATTADWSTTSFPNSAGTGDLIVATSANNYDNLNPGAAGDVLTSNGAGVQPSYQTPLPNVFTPTINSTKMVEVSQESDFGTAVGGVIILTGNTTYFIRGEVNCTNRLLIPNAGTAIIGWNRDEDSLNFTGGAGVGDFITITEQSFEIANIKLSSTNNTGGTVLLRAVNYNQPDYNAGRNKVLTIINCQFRNCFDVWFIEGFDLVDIQNTLVWYVQATTIGCQFKNVSKLQISSCEYVRWFDETSIPTPSGYATTSMVALLDNAGGSGFGAINISGCVIHPQQTQDGINISDLATIGFGTIASNTGIDIGLTTGVVANFDYDIQNSTIVQANQGIQNGNAKGILSLTDNIVLLDTSNATPAAGLYSLPIADASFVGGAGPTNPITFPVAQRVATSSANGSFTYDSKIDGNFNVTLNATVGVNANGTFDIQVQFRQNGTPLPLIGKATIRNSGGTFIAQPIGLSIQGTATQGDVFDVLISVASADDVLVSELILNGYQF